MEIYFSGEGHVQMRPCWFRLVWIEKSSMDILAKDNGAFRVSILVIGSNNYGAANKVSLLGSRGIQLQRSKFGLALGLKFLIARGYSVK